MELELGHLLWGQKPQKYFAPQHVIDALAVMSDVFYEKFGRSENPFSNTGAKFKNGVFEVEAYSWGDDEQPYNFKYKDIEISWYKHCLRDVTINKIVTEEEIDKMMIDCIRSLI